MKEMMIRLGSINAVKEFVALANGCAFDVDLVSGRYAVDAKSIMGIFSLNLDKPVKLVVHSDGSAAEDFVDAVRKFAA